MDGALDPQPGAAAAPPQQPDGPAPAAEDPPQAGAFVHGAVPAGIAAGLEGLLNLAAAGGAGVHVGGGVIHNEAPDFDVVAPPGVRDVVDGSEGHVPPCGSCGVAGARFRCTRCGVQRYCGADW